MVDQYFDFHTPLPLAQLIKDLVAKSNFDPNAPASTDHSAPREWLSQPRVSQNETVEILQISFKIPLSVSRVTMDILRSSCHMELWYQDRSDNWRQMYNDAGTLAEIDLSASAEDTWFRYETEVYPIVAKAVQVRLNRIFDPTLGSVPYSVGIRNMLMKREVRNRADATTSFETQQDSLGNVVVRYARDWGSAKAVDGNTQTFWKSAPQPDSDAVVCLYLDVRTPTGAAQIMDCLYMDPSHVGPHLNMYYSSDDTVGPSRISTVALAPDSEFNDQWQVTVGRYDIGATPLYRFPFKRGPLNSQDAWIGVNWIPRFDSSAGPALNPTLWSSVPGTISSTGTVITNYIGGTFAPTLTYNAGTSTFVLAFFDGTTTVSFTTPAVTFSKYQDLRIVCGWTFDSGPAVYIRITDSSGAVLATYSNSSATSLPSSISLDGEVSIQNWTGTLKALVVKMESWTLTSSLFARSPSIYCAPDPVIPDAQGHIPSTTLDNAIYAVDWTTQEHGMGGSDVSGFTAKTWTPIWRDFVATKGILFFPKAIAAKYLKLEFSALIPEPYPIYEAGIQTSYQVFPISVTRAASLSIDASASVGYSNGQFSAGADLKVNGKSVNFLDPFSVLGAVNDVLNPVIPPTVVTTGPGFTINSLPHTSDAPLSGDFDLETANPTLYRRTTIAPGVMAANTYNGASFNANFNIPPPDFSGIDWGKAASEIVQDVGAAIQAAPGVITAVAAAQAGDFGPALALPSQLSSENWVFPGEALKVPAAIMKALADSDISVGARATYDDRKRFDTVSIHQYDIRTLTRDAAIAYFAGIREVYPMMTSYINNADNDVWTFDRYTTDQWTVTAGTYQIYSPTGMVGALPQSTIAGDYAPTYLPTYGLTENYYLTLLGKDIKTTTSFSRLMATFRDSGVIRSNSMWDTTPGVTALAAGSTIIPAASIGAGMWSDVFADWADTVIDWGAAQGLVTVSTDSRATQGRRALNITRGAGAATVGIGIPQGTNFYYYCLFRVGCTVYRPVDTGNVVTLQLVRLSDGRVMSTWTVPVQSGQWFTWTSPFAGINSNETDYQLQIVLSGSAAETFYVADLFTEIAGVRYLVQMGGPSGSAPLQDVTDLAYKGAAYIASTTPVTEFSVTVAICSPNAYAIGCELTPSYNR